MSFQNAFLCRACEADVTGFLRPGTEPSCALERGVAVVPSGYFILVTRPWTYREFLAGPGGTWSYASGDGDIIAFERGDFLVNSGDVHHTVHPSASHGCCGWQPRGEPNALCANGHFIGTVHSDTCWSPQVFRLIHSLVCAVTVTH